MNKLNKIFLSISLFLTPIFAYELNFDEYATKAINVHPEKEQIKIRLNEYGTLKENLKHFSTMKKISMVNLFINQATHKLDEDGYGIDDYWATPKEFLLNGYGDCEDFAIAKYFTLLELGIDKNDLYLANVIIKKKNESHMVLLYKDKKMKTPIVLDNIINQILPLNKRADLTQIAAFNESSWYRLNNNELTFHSAVNFEREGKWETLLYRVYHLND